jgi:hypothetical protein
MTVDVFHIGPQKSATTWVYDCLKEHPEVVVSKSDTVHYYDMFYHKGREWYKNHFPVDTSGKKVFDPTCTYIRSPWAPRRIAAEYPEAKFILCLRNPIDRAFSHYWHEKKKQKIAFEFKEVLENYDLYSSWIETGMYAEHIERYLQYFDREQFLFLKFEDLKQDPEQLLHRILTFIDIDTNFRPSILDKKSNAATGKKTLINRGWNRTKSVLVDIGLKKSLQKLNVDQKAKRIESLPYVGKLLNNKGEYEQGVPIDVKNKLLDLIEPEIGRLENLLNIELESWKS